MRPVHPDRSRSAFTIIELLVVIAVVAILLGLLLPSLASAREGGRTSKCAANLHQIDILMVTYVEDNREAYPAHRSATADGTDADWWWGTEVFETSFTTRQERAAAEPAALAGAYALFHCPSIRDGEAVHNYAWTWHFDAHRVGYGYNAFFFGFSPYGRAEAQAYYNGWGNTGGRTLVTTPSMRNQLVTLPAQTVLLADSCPRPDGLWSMSMWFPSIVSAFEGIDTRHGGRRDTAGRGNIVFADGHLSRLADGEVNEPVAFRAKWDPRWPSSPGPWW